jgi:hypothetical protein
MKTRIFFLAILFSQLLSAQTEENFTYFYSYEDYPSNAPLQEEVITIVKEQTSEYILIDSQTYKNTGDRAKKAIHSWALKFNNDIYMNMMSAAFISSGKTFAKFDIIGKKYMVILLDEKQDRKAFSYNNNPYGGGGLIGAALNVKPKSSWKDKNGKNYKILFIDIEKPMRGPRGLEKNVIGILLDTQKILELYSNDKNVIEKLKKSEYLVEDFIEFVNRANQ